MTIQERATELLTAGAAMWVGPPVGESLGDTVLLAALTWLTKPTRLKWCAVYPTDQHHIHTLPYTGAALVAGGRDIAVYGGRKIMVAYICPFQESGLDEGKSKDILIHWRDLMAGANQEAFDQFFAQG